MKEEEWNNKDSKRIVIDGVVLPYLIFTDGSVWSYRSKKFLKPQKVGGQIKSGRYHLYGLSYRTIKYQIYAHRLVAEHFLIKPEGDDMEVNHKDEDKLNNDVSNLEWMTKSDNMKLLWENNRDSIREAMSTSTPHTLPESERVKLRAKLYQEKNAEAISKYRRKYYLDNIERTREYKRAYYEKNKEKIIAQNKKWRNNNKEKIKETNRLNREKKRSLDNDGK